MNTYLRDQEYFYAQHEHFLKWCEYLFCLNDIEISNKVKQKHLKNAQTFIIIVQTILNYMNILIYINILQIQE